MPDQFLDRDASTGQVTQKNPIATSSGSGDAGKIIKTGADGKIDATFLSATGNDASSKTTSGAFTAGDLAYIKSDGNIARASAAVAGNAADGFVLASSTTGNTNTIYFEGRITGLSGLTVGARYYLSDSTPGGITSTPVTGTGKLHQYIGKAISATELNFEPDDAIVLA